MKIWVVNIREDGNNVYHHEYYTNEKAANERADYIEENFYLIAWAKEVEVMETPAKGYPKF